MENEIDKLYSDEYSEDEEQIEQPQEKDYYSEVPPDFKYTPVEIPHRIDWFVLLLVWVIIGALGYILFATTSVFE